MNASVLIVGEDDFPSQLIQRVRGLSAMSVRQARHAAAAAALVEAELPEFIVMQAQQPDNWELCRHLKHQRHLVWIYCILLDNRSCIPTYAPEQVLLRQASLTTTALEAGADAYLWVPDAFSDAHPQEEIETYLSRLIQAHLRVALRRIQAHQELSQTNDLLSAIALLDALTELGNRRAFDWELPRQIEAARRQNTPLSLLLLDIDFFKSINDDYGHLVGDRVLRMLADRLRHNMRFYETPFRYGGEEFVVLMQNTTPEEAQRVGERLRRLIHEAPFVIDEQLDLSLTVSIGVATLTETDDAKGIDLVARADANLLKAKATGRNRVVVS